MSILKSVRSILEGMGPGGFRGGTVTAAASATPALSVTLNQPANCGYVRVQVKGNTGGGGFTSCSVRGTDINGGFWDIGYAEPSAAGAAGDQVSLIFPFITDVGLATVTATLVLAAAPTPAGSTQTDLEVWGSLM